MDRPNNRGYLLSVIFGPEIKHLDWINYSKYDLGRSHTLSGFIPSEIDPKDKKPIFSYAKYGKTYDNAILVGMLRSPDLKTDLKMLKLYLEANPDLQKTLLKIQENGVDYPPAVDVFLIGAGDLKGRILRILEPVETFALMNRISNNHIDILFAGNKYLKNLEQDNLNNFRATWNKHVKNGLIITDDMKQLYNTLIDNGCNIKRVTFGGRSYLVGIDELEAWLDVRSTEQSIRTDAQRTLMDLIGGTYQTGTVNKKGLVKSFIYHQDELPSSITLTDGNTYDWSTTRKQNSLLRTYSKDPLYNPIRSDAVTIYVRNSNLLFADGLNRNLFTPKYFRKDILDLLFTEVSLGAKKGSGSGLTRAALKIVQGHLEKIGYSTSGRRAVNLPIFYVSRYDLDEVSLIARAFFWKRYDNAALHNQKAMRDNSSYKKIFYLGRATTTTEKFSFSQDYLKVAIFNHDVAFSILQNKIIDFLEEFHSYELSLADSAEKLVNLIMSRSIPITKMHFESIFEASVYTLVDGSEPLKMNWSLLETSEAKINYNNIKSEAEFTNLILVHIQDSVFRYKLNNCGTNIKIQLSGNPKIKNVGNEKHWTINHPSIPDLYGEPNFLKSGELGEKWMVKRLDVQGMSQYKSYWDIHGKQLYGTMDGVRQYSASVLFADDIDEVLGGLKNGDQYYSKVSVGGEGGTVFIGVGSPINGFDYVGEVVSAARRVRMSENTHIQTMSNFEDTVFNEISKSKHSLLGANLDINASDVRRILNQFDLYNPDYMGQTKIPKRVLSELIAVAVFANEAPLNFNTELS